MTVCLKRLYSQRLILLLRERERERGREGGREGGRAGGRERERDRFVFAPQENLFCFQ